MHQGDFRPKPKKLPKGEYSIKVQIRHDDPVLLQKFTDQILHIERKLDKKVTLNIYSSQFDALAGGATAKDTKLRKGTSAVLFVAAPADSALPKEAKVGDILTGNGAVLVCVVCLFVSTS